MVIYSVLRDGSLKFGGRSVTVESMVIGGLYVTAVEGTRGKLC